MPRVSKEKEAAPVAAQASRETSTVGKSERSVNPSIPSESFPSSANIHRRHFWKQVALTAFLSVVVLFMLFFVLAGLSSSHSLSFSSIDFPEVMSPSSLGGYLSPSAPRTMKAMAPQFYAFDRAVVGMAVGEPETMPPVPSPEENAATPNLPDERKIIRNGHLRLLVSDVVRASEQISNVVSVFSGFVESLSLSDGSNIYGYQYDRSMGKGKSGSMTVRVPAEKFDSAMGSIKALATRVESESSNSQDVSAQYVDLEARLKNLRVTEERYLELIATAKNVEEVLKVESYLSNTRENIERIQGQINLLSRQVAMSTISIELVSEPSPVVETEAWRPMTVAKQALQNLTKGVIDLANNAIAFLIILPLLLIRIALWVVALLIAWRVGKWLYGKVRGKALPPAGGAVS